jgi:arabinoxylan arabinofuranohydrolase
VQASSFTTSPGIQSETCTDTNGGLDVGFADDGDHLMFGQMNFTFGLTAVDLRVASAGSGGRVDLRIDALDGPLIASVALPVTGDGRRGRR